MLEIKAVSYIDVHDLQDYIRETYGKNLDLIRMLAEHSGNNTIVKLDVNKDMPYDAWFPRDDYLYDKPDLAMRKWIDGDETVNANECLILWDMCRKDVIPEGTYVIDVWW